MLKQTGEFHPVRLPSVWPERILIECRPIQPEILPMDVTSPNLETTIEAVVENTKSSIKSSPNVKALCSAMKQLIQSWRRTSCTPSKAG